MLRGKSHKSYKGDFHNSLLIIYRALVYIELSLSFCANFISQMFIDWVFKRKRTMTNMTEKRLFLCVFPHVSVQMVFSGERHLAIFFQAWIWFFTSMYLDVTFQIFVCWKRFFTKMAYIFFWRWSINFFLLVYLTQQPRIDLDKSPNS